VLVRDADTTVLIDTGLGPKPRTFIPEPDALLLDELARRAGSSGSSPTKARR